MCGRMCKNAQEQPSTCLGWNGGWKTRGSEVDKQTGNEHGLHQMTIQLWALFCR